MIISYTIPKQPPRRYETESETVYIGKKAKSKKPIDIDLESDDYVSRRHSCICFDGEEYWLEDLGSANGTWLNGERIQKKARLSPGDAIQIGYTIFAVHIEQTLIEKETAGDPDPEEPYIVEDLTQEHSDRAVTVINPEVAANEDLYEVTIDNEEDVEEIPPSSHDDLHEETPTLFNENDEAPPPLSEEEDATVMNPALSLPDEKVLRERTRDTTPRGFESAEEDRRTAPRSHTVQNDYPGKEYADLTVSNARESRSDYRTQTPGAGEFVMEEEAASHPLTGYAAGGSKNAFQQQSGTLMRALNHLNRQMGLAENLDEVLSILFRQLPEVIIPDMDTGSVLLEDSSGSIVPRASWPDNTIRIPMDKARKVFALHQALIWIASEKTSGDPAAALFAPIALGDDVCGVIYIGNRKRRSVFSDLSLQILKLIAGLAAHHIRNFAFSSPSAVLR